MAIPLRESAIVPITDMTEGSKSEMAATKHTELKQTKAGLR